MKPFWLWLTLVATLVGLAAGCDDVSAEGVLQPDTRLRPLPKPATSATPKGSPLFETEPLARALEKLTHAMSAGDENVELSLLELRAMPDKLILQAEDPKAQGRIVQWEYSNGEVKAPRTVELRGAGKLDENLFPIEGVYLQAIPRLCSIAVSHVDPQDGRVTQIVVRRNLPFSSDVRFRVFVASPRKNGQLDANRFGHPLLG